MLSKLDARFYFRLVKSSKEQLDLFGLWLLANVHLITQSYSRFKTLYTGLIHEHMGKKAQLLATEF